MAKLVIGLSHFWSAYMVCVYRDNDVQSPIEDALTSTFVPELVLQSGLSFWV